MKITYTNSLEDWAAAQAHELDTSVVFRDAVLVWRWALAIGAGVLVAWAASHSSTLVRAGSGCAVGVAIYFWYPRYVRTRYLTAGLAQMKVKESLPFLTGERSLEVTADGLRLQSTVGEHLIRWVFVKAVEEDAKHVFVRYRYGLGLSIPKTSMTPGDKEALINSLRVRVQGPANPALNPTGLRPAG